MQIRCAVHRRGRVALANARRPATAVLLVSIALGGCRPAAIPADDPHTEATLALQQTGQQLSVELYLPAYSALGFDHRPASTAEREQLQTAVHQLRNGSTLLGLPAAASCVQRTVRIESPLLAVYDDRDRQRPAGTAPPTKTSGSTTFHVRYRFDCSAPAAGHPLAPQLLQHYPHLQRVAIDWQGVRLGVLSQQRTIVVLPALDASQKAPPQQ